MSNTITINVPEVVAARLAAGRHVIREKHHFDLTLRHRAVIDALVMESLSQGEASVVIPSSQTLHELCGVPVQHIPQVVGELVTCRVVRAVPTEDGMTRYTVNPDTETWRVRPTVGHEASRAARSLVATLNRRASDGLPANFKADLTVPAFSASHDSCGCPCNNSGETPTGFFRKPDQIP